METQNKNLILFGLIVNSIAIIVMGRNRHKSEGLLCYTGYKIKKDVYQWDHSHHTDYHGSKYGKPIDIGIT